MTIIFISHAKADAACAEQLRQDLEAQGYTVWREPTSTTLDSILNPQSIDSTILGSAALILLWSSHTPHSTEVMDRLSLAQRLKKPVFPVLIDGASPASITSPAGLPATLPFTTSPIIANIPCTNIAAQLLPLLPQPHSADPLIKLLEQVTQYSTFTRQDAIDQAADILMRGEHSEQILALLDYLAHNDPMNGVRDKAQEVLHTMTQARNPLVSGSDAKDIIGVPCRNGHTTYFNKRRICLDKATLVRTFKQDGKEVSERNLKCGQCGASLKVNVDCRGYK